MRSGSATEFEYLQTRTEGGQRVLEHHLHALAHTPQIVAAQGSQVLSVEQDRTCRWLGQEQHHAAQGSLATARLSHQPKHLAAPDLQIDAVHRVNVASAAGKPAAGQSKMLDQSVYRDQRSVGSGHGCAPSARKHALLCPASTASSSGSSSRQRSKANWQRGAKGQPVTAPGSEGTLPGIAVSGTPRLAARGMAAISPWV